MGAALFVPCVLLPLRALPLLGSTRSGTVKASSALPLSLLFLTDLITVSLGSVSTVVLLVQGVDPGCSCGPQL